MISPALQPSGTSVEDKVRTITKLVLGLMRQVQFLTFTFSGKWFLV